MVSSLFDRISTCRIARPSLDARSGTNVVGLIPHFYGKAIDEKDVVLMGVNALSGLYLISTFWSESEADDLNKCQCPLGLIPHFYFS